jgi:hypothetical protein
MSGAVWQLNRGFLLSGRVSVANAINLRSSCALFVVVPLLLTGCSDGKEDAPQQARNFIASWQLVGANIKGLTQPPMITISYVKSEKRFGVGCTEDIGTGLLVYDSNSDNALDPSYLTFYFAKPKGLGKSVWGSLDRECFKIVMAEHDQSDCRLFSAKTRRGVQKSTRDGVECQVWDADWEEVCALKKYK